MTVTTKNAVSTPAIKKFEVGKTYAAKKSVLFDSQINMTVIKRTKCYVSFQFDDEDDIRRCKIVDDAGVEKICLHETNAIGGDYEFSANDVADETATDETATDEVKSEEDTEIKNQSANAVSTPAIETRIASNGAVSVYVNGKRTGREEAIEIAEQNDLPTYTATCYPYSERNYCINEDFATALSAYKWMEPEVDKKKKTAIITLRKDVVFMATLGYTRFGVTTKFEDANQNTVSKTYNGLNLTGTANDCFTIEKFFVNGMSTVGGQSAAMFDLLGDNYSLKTIDRNMNNEVILE